METEFSSQEKDKIYKGIRKKYKQVAKKPDGLFKYPTGKAGLEALQYDPEIIMVLPETVTASYCGVGNPFTLGAVNEGESVLDIGCGSGVDTIFAAKMTGSSGRVVGVDLMPEMLQRAKENLKLANIDNVTYEKASSDNLSFPDENFDVVISNGVFNLVPDKAKALSEAFRVLKPGGRLMIADQILIGELTKDRKEIIKSWFQWEGGAIPEKDFLAIFENTGFTDIEFVNETGFNSSPKTKGVLIRAKKLSGPQQKETKHSLEPQVDSPDSSTPINEWNPRGAKLEDVLTKAFELGAEKAKIIDTNTVVVEKWVLWKCRYGCNLYEKDAYHPPLTPDAQNTKEVLQEYSKAILINGSKGKKLTEIAVRLEGEAYNMGYYKAFALTSLSSGPAGATWPSGEKETLEDSQAPEQNKIRIRPLMEACGIDVFRTARANGFEIDTKKETYGRWNYFALVLVE